MSNVQFETRVKTILNDKAAPFVVRFKTYLSFENEFKTKGCCHKLITEGMKIVFLTAFNNYMEMLAVCEEHLMCYGEKAKKTEYYKFMIDQLELQKQIMFN